MRRLIAVAAAWLVVACASAGQPPGGPEDHDPPVIVSVKPDSGQLNVRPREIDFQFDEVVAQQALGATDLSRLFLVSPRDGDPDVSWHRSRITLKLRKFRSNMAYVVTMLPGLADLRGNIRKEGASIIFSTGPTIPRLGITGVVFDWAAQHTAPNALVEAISRADTTLQFVAVSDTTGRFEIGPIDTGVYLVRALIDANSNRQIDRAEKWDTTETRVTDVRPAVELDAVERDSTPALLTNVITDDSITIHVVFDKYLDPALPLQPALVDLKSADSTRMEVVSVQWGTAFDAARRAADSTRRIDSARTADSLARARDTSRARAAQPPIPVNPAPRPPAGVGVPGARPAPPPAKPKALPPDKAVVLTLSPNTRLVPGRSYHLTVRGFRNLVGHAVDQSRTFQVPLPKPPPKDTTRARSDSTRPPVGRPPPSKPPH
ncbi:MAG TPA: Ig-like domain-containing protein [Gemmatimonadaceae bacterium]|nr:Ig-like domain-containing protein [Gemmatimonadaceae bacterium]